MNGAGKARQKWYARAATEFTKPVQSLLAELCRNKKSQVEEKIKDGAFLQKSAAVP